MSVGVGMFVAVVWVSIFPDSANPVQRYHWRETHSIATRSTEGDFSKSALFPPPDAELNLKAIMGLYSENIGGQRQPLQPL